VSTRGVVYVHSTPLAVCAHVEWAIARVLTTPVSLQWTVQPADPACRRAESGWTGRAGTAADLATELRQWPMIRFEVTEEPSAGVDGERYMHVPGRGLHRATIGAAGDIQLGEDMLRHLMDTARSPEAFTLAVERALGSSWDAELEPYRWAGDGAPVTLLTRAS
jgi:hypothetical protein